MSSYPPLCLPDASITQYNSPKENSWLGKRDPYCPDVDHTPERKRARQNLLEERGNTNQQTKHLPDSFPLLATTSSASEVVMSSTVPEALSPTSSDVTSDLESEAEWTIEYNTEIKKSVDVSLIHSVNVGTRIGCLKFSKDGKNLAVGFYENGTTNIYAVQSGERTWLVFH
jgi:hypothetical protein